MDACHSGLQKVVQTSTSSGSKITKDQKGNNALPYIGPAGTQIETSPQLQYLCIARQTAVDSTHPSYQSYMQNSMSTYYSTKCMDPKAQEHNTIMLWRNTTQ